MATGPEQTGSKRNFWLGCGCLVILASLCCVCSGASLVLWPDYFGLESTFEQYGLTDYRYENVRQLLPGQPTAEPTVDSTLPTPEPIPTQAPTATFTPFPTFTPSPSPTATATVPPTDTPQPTVQPTP